MPDPNVTLAAIQSHAAALAGAIQRHSANAGRCKVWGVGVVAGVILLAGSRGQGAVVSWVALPWMAGVVVMLALADACCVAMARGATDAYNRFMAKVPLNGGNAMKAEEWLVLPGADLGIRDAGSVLRALGSFTVWPFYGAMLALVGAFYFQMAGGQGDLEKGRLGERSAKAGQSGTVTASQGVKVLPRPTPGGPQFPGNPGNAPSSNPAINQPKQPALVPLKTAPQQPGVRIPSAPANAPGAGAAQPLQPGVRFTPNAIPAPVPPRTSGTGTVPKITVPPATGAPAGGGVPPGGAAPANGGTAPVPPGVGTLPATPPQPPGAGGTPALQPTGGTPALQPPAAPAAPAGPR